MYRYFVLVVFFAIIGCRHDASEIPLSDIAEDGYRVGACYTYKPTDNPFREDSIIFQVAEVRSGYYRYRYFLDDRYGYSAKADRSNRTNWREYQVEVPCP